MRTAATALAPDTGTPGRHRFALSTSVFLRLLAMVHLSAFASFWMQWPGLIGPHGISPAGVYLGAVHAQLGAGGIGHCPPCAGGSAPEPRCTSSARLAS